MIDFFVLVVAQQPGQIAELVLELLPIGLDRLRVDRADPEDIDEPGPTVRSTRRRRSRGPLRARHPPGNRGSRNRRRRLRREDPPIQDRQPGHRKQGADRREELKRVVTDDVDSPDTTTLGRGPHVNRAVVREREHRFQVAAHFGAAEDAEIVGRKRRQVMANPPLGVTSQELTRELFHGSHGQKWTLQTE